MKNWRKLPYRHGLSRSIFVSTRRLILNAREKKEGGGRTNKETRCLSYLPQPTRTHFAALVGKNFDEFPTNDEFLLILAGDRGKGQRFSRDKKERNGRFCSVSSSRSPVADRRRWGGHYHKPRSFGVGEFMKIELNCSAPSRKRR